MSRAPLVRALIALGIVAGSTYITVTTPARLGLDLRGGTQIVLETQDSPTVEGRRKESTDRALEVLRRRVDALGVAEPTLARSGDRRIIVELPGCRTRARRPTSSAGPPSSASTPSSGRRRRPRPVTRLGPEPAADGEQVLPDEDGLPVRIGPSALTGDGVGGAAAELDPQGLSRWSVTVDFKGSGGAAWQS